MGGGGGEGHKEEDSSSQVEESQAPLVSPDGGVGSDPQSREGGRRAEERDRI